MLLASGYRMPRLRILLLLLWYYSITKVSNAADISEKLSKPTQQPNNEETMTDKWDYSKSHRQIKSNENSRCEDCRGGKTNEAIPKIKREISESDDIDNDDMVKDKRPEKNRRKVGVDIVDTGLIDTDNTKYLKHLANLISRYRGKYVQYGFVVGRAEDIIDLDMIRRCLHPVEIPKHFSPWLGKRGTRVQDTMQKKCLETLVQPVNYRPASIATDDGKFLKPFRPWGGKRDGGDAKKTHFGAWGGKRSFDPDTKRAQFRAWGGKRFVEYPFNTDYLPETQHLTYNNLDGIDRQSRDAKFSAWGGKRNSKYPTDATYPILYNLDNRERQLRDSKFNAWGGKRNLENSELYESPENMERQSRDAKFNAWGGKRDPEFPFDPTYPAVHSSGNIERQSRDAKFNAWGGKRSLNLNPTNINVWETPENENMIEELILPSNDGSYVMNSDYPDALFLTRNRINVQSTGNIASFQEKLLSPEFEDELRASGINPKETEGSIKEKRNFSTWGGKRSVVPENDDYPERKRKFGAWGGKRSQKDITNVVPEISDANEASNNNIDMNSDEIESLQKFN